MGYYMGDASAARHQGGFFSFVGKALRTVSKIVPGPLGVIGQLAGQALGGGRPASIAQTAMATFMPSVIPGAPVTASTGYAPVSTPPSILQTMPAAPSAPAARAPRRKTGRRTAKRYVPRTRSRRSSSSARRRANTATRARLRARGYRF